MTFTQQLITIGMVILGHGSDPFSSFSDFSRGKAYAQIYSVYRKVPSIRGVWPAGRLLSAECKSVSGSHGVPELLSIALVAVLHLWKGQMLQSIAAGTVCYMLLVQFVF